jgi:hypothetical protein
MQIEGEEINEAVSNNNSSSISKNQQRRTATSRITNRRDPSSASSAKGHTSQTNALSANNQPIKRRAATKTRDMHT